MLKPVSRWVLIKKLKELGFTGPFTGGRHEFMERGDLRLVIPNPHRGDIGVKLLGIILKQIGISASDFEKL